MDIHLVDSLELLTFDLSNLGRHFQYQIYGTQMIALDSRFRGNDKAGARPRPILLDMRFIFWARSADAPT
jgi:hypothetical protein